MTTEEFINRAKLIYGDKYDYSKVNYINSHTKVCIICPVHEEFWQSPYYHLKGHGCKKCADKFTEIKQGGPSKIPVPNEPKHKQNKNNQNKFR